ncbi:MAG: 30S ribosomal protein S4 [bacterium]|nr:30S ribosomal protein S4 [bacterium]
MARYTDAVCRLCRREGRKLYLKGERCESPKCAINKRNFPPGQAGLGRNKVSPYGMQLREKQRAKRIYGLLEAQFRQVFARADHMNGVTGTLLLQLLESRLDNLVYRMGFATSRAAARQLVRHGNVLVDGRKIDIPSCRIKVGQVVTVKPRFKEAEMVKHSLDVAGKRPALSWIELNPETVSGRLLAMPAREDIPVELNEQLIVELYSK